MQTTYFIGGAPRSGKTTLIQKLISQKPMTSASTDSIRSVARGISSIDTNPKLFQKIRGTFGSDRHIDLLKNDPDLALKSEIESAQETFKSVIDFISYYQRDGIDTAIEGVAVLPHILKGVDFNFKAVFFVYTDDQTEIILSSARNNKSDWLAKFDDETIKLYCKFNQMWNVWYLEEANKYGFPVVDVSDDFESSLQKAVDILLADQ